MERPACQAKDKLLLGEGRQGHFTFYISHSTFYVLHFTFHILYFTFNILHFTLNQNDDVEFLFARDLQILAGYAQWRNFLLVIDKAKTACTKAKQDILDHFAEVSKMVEVGSGAKREVNDIILTRYACYLIAQNGDPKKNEIAFAMNYFEVQTSKQELLEQRLQEWERLRTSRRSPARSRRTKAYEMTSQRSPASQIT